MLGGLGKMFGGMMGGGSEKSGLKVKSDEELLGKTQGNAKVRRKAAEGKQISESERSSLGPLVRNIMRRSRG